MKLSDYLIARGKQNEEAVTPDPLEPTADDYKDALEMLGVNTDDENAVT